MRHAIWALALLVAALAGSASAPRGPELTEPAPSETLLEPTTIRAASGPCVGAAPEARVSASYVALRWERACGGGASVLWRGPSAAELVPLVEIAHAGHVDVDVLPGRVHVYAVQPAGGALGPAIAVTLPPA